MIARLLVYALLIIFCSGCASKTKIIPLKIGDELLQIPKIDTNRTVNSELEASEFMIDIFGAYQKCILNLKTIKELNSER